MVTKARAPAHLDYICDGCGAQAVSVAEPGRRGNGTTRVMVPHGPGCPVAIRVALMRMRAQVPAGRSAR